MTAMMRRTTDWPDIPEVSVLLPAATRKDQQANSRLSIVRKKGINRFLKLTVVWRRQGWSIVSFLLQLTANKVAQEFQKGLQSKSNSPQSQGKTSGGENTGREEAKTFQHHSSKQRTVDGEERANSSSWESRPSANHSVGRWPTSPGL